MPTFLLASLPAAGLILLQNHAVTRKWTTLPYMLSQYQYGVPASLLFLPMPEPHRQLTPQQQQSYASQLAVHSGQAATVSGFVNRLEYRLRFYRFFFAAPAVLALPFAYMAYRERRFFWMIVFPIIFMLGTGLYPFFFVHYVAAVACVFVLWSVTALECLSKLSFRGQPFGRMAAMVILFACAANFLFWYGLHIFDHEPFSIALRRYENADALNHRQEEFRGNMTPRLAQMRGKLLIFVHYSPRHIFHMEWVYNDADIDHSRIVWARDLGPAENKKLMRYYPDRAAWFFQPDDGDDLSRYSAHQTLPNF